MLLIAALVTLGLWALSLTVGQVWAGHPAPIGWHIAGSAACGFLFGGAYFAGRRTNRQREEDEEA